MDNRTQFQMENYFEQFDPHKQADYSYMHSRNQSGWVNNIKTLLLSMNMWMQQQV
jgi:hypothetical protein